MAQKKSWYYFKIVSSKFNQPVFLVPTGASRNVLSDTSLVTAPEKWLTVTELMIRWVQKHLESLEPAWVFAGATSQILYFSNSTRWSYKYSYEKTFASRLTTERVNSL